MKLRKTTITLALGVTVFLLILGLIYASLNASWIHNRIFTFLEKRTGWSILADDISINPFLGSIEVRKANVISKTKRAVFVVEEISIRVSPLSAIRGRIIVNHLNLHNVFLSFEGKLKKKKGPTKFTLDRITKVAREVSRNFALQYVTVKSGQIGPVNILIPIRKGGYTDLYIENSKFDLSRGFLGNNDFHFSAENFRIKGEVVASKLELNSVLSAKQVVFDTLDFERPEGSYSVYLKPRVEKDEIRGDIRVTANIPKAFQKEIEGEGIVSLKPPYLFIKPFTIRVGELSLDALGRMYVPKGEYDVDFEMPKSSLEAVWAAMNLPYLSKIDGAGTLKGKMKAKLPKLGVVTQIEASPVRYDPFQLDELSATIEMKGREISWIAHSPHPEASKLSSEGRAAIRGTPDKLILEEFSLNFRDARLSHFLVDAKVDGTLRGQADLRREKRGLIGSGELSLADGRIQKTELKKAEVTFKFDGKRLIVDRFGFHVANSPEINTTHPLYVDFGVEKITIQGDPSPGVSLLANYAKSSKLWTLQKFHFKKGDDLLSATGLIRANKTFQLKVSGDLNARNIAAFRPVFNDAYGILNLNIQASGSIKKPKLRGSVQFKRVMMDIRGFGDPIRDLNGRLSIRPNQLVLEKIEGFHSDGDFKIDGTVGIEGLEAKSFNLSLEGNGLTFRLRNAMQVDFNTNLKVLGAMPSPRVSGNVELLTGRYYKNFQITKAVFAERGVPEIKDKAEIEFLKDWRWDVKIRNSGDLRIENNMANVFLDGDLHLKGTTRRPVIEGVVTTSGGELFYLGNELKIAEGSLEFRDPNRINPYMSLEAQKEVAGAESRGLRSFYTVYVELKGPLDNLEISLWSSPPLDQSDVVSLLAFGMTQTELKARGSARRAFATSFLADSLMSGFGEGIGDVFGLDVVRVELEEGSTQAISGVALGKNLSDRLSIEFYTDITPDSAHRRVRSKYYLTDNIFLEGANIVEEDRNEFELNVSLQFKIRQ